MHSKIIGLLDASITDVISHFVKRNPRYISSVMDIAIHGYQLEQEYRLEVRDSQCTLDSYYYFSGLFINNNLLLMYKTPQPGLGHHKIIEQDLARFMGVEVIGQQTQKDVMHALQQAMIIQITNNPILCNSPGLINAWNIYVRQEGQRYKPHMIFKAAKRIDALLARELKRGLLLAIKETKHLTADFCRAAEIIRDKTSPQHVSGVMLTPDIFVFSLTPSTQEFVHKEHLSTIKDIKSFIENYALNHTTLKEIFYRYFSDLIDGAKPFFLISASKNLSQQIPSDTTRLLPDILLSALQQRPNGHITKESLFTISQIQQALTHRFHLNPESAE